MRNQSKEESRYTFFLLEHKTPSTEYKGGHSGVIFSETSKL